MNQLRYRSAPSVCAFAAVIATSFVLLPAAGSGCGVSEPSASVTLAAEGPDAAPPAEVEPPDAAPSAEVEPPAAAPPTDASAGAFASCPATVAAYTKTSDVAYAALHPAQKLDLYVPDGAGPFPLIVWVHGGGWQTGDKAPTPAAAQAKRGYVVASVNYRLSGDAIFPAQIHDVKAAVRWLRANAAAYKIDRARVAAWGPSAGGHLVALLGTSGGVAAMEDLSLGNPGESSRVQAVVDFFGPTDFSKRRDGIPEACGGELEHDDDATSPSSALLGCPLNGCPEAVQAANPLAYVTADDPPFSIMHGDSDCTVVPSQSQILADALRASGVPAALEFLPGAVHADPAFFDPVHRAKVERFFDAVLKRCR
ncbi:MAG TPA: alpha/beta hydrolase [Polyangiaceae bacterium]|nr:alpha/beta hydrolase [Polyangiaceae bacterium]